MKEMRDRTDCFLGAAAEEIRVSSFHSLYAHIIRCECDSVGIPADFGTFDEDGSRLVLREVLTGLRVPVRPERRGWLEDLLSDYI
ncbi:MAG: hypothetical protein ACPLRW_13285 [Moorellales bacterium]